MSFSISFFLLSSISLSFLLKTETWKHEQRNDKSSNPQEQAIKSDELLENKEKRDIIPNTHISIADILEVIFMFLHKKSLNFPSDIFLSSKNLSDS